MAFGSSAIDFLHWVAVILISAWGWPVLIVSVTAFVADWQESPSLHRVAAIVAVLASLVGCGIGFFLGLAWVNLLTQGFFGYIPTVYAPIFLGHAALAMVLSRSCRVPATRERFLDGAAVLAGVAILALFFQFSGTLNGWAQAVVGLALPGYVLVALAGQEEVRQRISGASWLSRGGSPRDL